MSYEHDRPADGGLSASREHAVQFYADDSFRVDVVARMVPDGLTAGGPLLIIATEPHRAAFRRRLEELGIDVDQAGRDARIQLLDARVTLAAFMVDGEPDPARFRTVIGGALSRAGAAADRPVRVYGEMVDLLCADGNPAAAVAVETLWTSLAADHHFSLLSGYSQASLADLHERGVWTAERNTHAHLTPAALGAGTDGEQPVVSQLQQRTLVLEAAIARRVAVERSLIESRHELQDFIENATIGLHWCDADGIIVWANQAELDLLGYARDEYVGHPIVEFHIDRPVIGGLLAELGRNEILREHETRVRCRDGSIRHVVVDVSVRWRDGHFLHTRCFTRDVTAQKRSREALERLQAITGALSQAQRTGDVIEVVLGQGIAAVGAFAGNAFRVDPSGAWLELVGAHGYPAAMLRPHARISVDAITPLSEAARAGTPVFVPTGIAEAYPSLADATRLTGTTAVAAVPMIVEGKVTGVLGFSFQGAPRFDETDRMFLLALGNHCAQAIERARLFDAERRARQDAEAATRRASLLAEASALLATSLEVQPALTQIAALAAAELGLHCWIERVGEPGSSPDPGPVPEGSDQGQTQLAADRTGVVVPLVARGRRHGALVFAGATGPLPSADVATAEELGRRIALALDNARLFREARDADRRKDEFLAMLGHELRNPLAPIMTALELMRLRGGAEREQQVIDRQVQHLARLVDDLLDVSRITRGKVQLAREPLEVASVLAKAIEMASPLFEQRAHVLSIDVPREGLRVDADPVRLAQVIENLLTNAARYTEPGGRIRVSAAREGAEVVLAVEDNGHGIAPAMLAQIFELFVQGGQPIDRQQGGLGLGLAVARNMAELHGGTITAVSAGVGTGSKFVVRLPALPDSVPVRPSGPRPALRRMSASLRVLVVDDNIDAAETIAMALESFGHEVVVAHDGPAALAAAGRLAPDVALVDIGLPVMDGFELAGRLRELLPGPLRLIAVTGYGQETDKARSRAAGFDDHLVKPVGLEVLLGSLDRTTGRDVAATPRVRT